jgi:hypothetical protein
MAQNLVVLLSLAIMSQALTPLEKQRALLAEHAPGGVPKSSRITFTLAKDEVKCFKEDLIKD